MERLHGLTEILSDLTAQGPTRKSPGISYEIFGSLNCCGTANTTWPRGPARIALGAFPNGLAGWGDSDAIIKTETTTARYVHANSVFNLRGHLTPLEEIWLIKEADVNPEPGYRGPANNNYPAPLDNHDALGENILFVDGHVEFVKQRKYIYSYELGGDEGRSGP